MKRHDETLLWQYAARELDAETAALTEHHLSECVDCREGLLDVRQARLYVQDAQTPKPQVDWAKVDAGISKIVESRLAKQARRARFDLRLPVLAACVAALVAVLSQTVKPEWFQPAAAVPAPVAEVVPLENDGTHVVEAQGLSRVGAQVAQAGVGEKLNAGDVLRTAVGGRAVLTLPDASRMRLMGGTQVALTRSEADDVALTLERGRVGVKASHRERKGFVVHSGGVTVRVIGTVFTVSQVAGVVEVVVAEGRVQVEPPEGNALFVSTGERVRFERGQWKAIRGNASKGQLAELEEFTTPPMVEAKGAPRAPAVVPSAGGVALAQKEPAPQKEGPLPRKPSNPAGEATKWPTVGEPPPAAPPAPQTPQFEEKASVFPSLGGGPVQYEPRVQVPPPAQPEHQAIGKPTPPDEMPAAETYVAPAPPPAPKGEVPATDLEAIFLKKAERSLDKGTCERFLLGLQELASDQSKSDRSELARILRARCFDARIRTDLSEIEYRRYLETWPKGRYADEARKAIAE